MSVYKPGQQDETPEHEATTPPAAPASAEIQFATLELAGGKYSRDWWIDTGDRVVSTVAQAAIATLTAGAIPGLLDVNLVAVLSVSGLAGAIALLKAFAITRSGSTVS